MEPRADRWDTLVPLATFVAAAAALALIAPHVAHPHVPVAAVPVVGALAKLVAAIAPDDGVALRGVAIAVVAAAVTAIGALVAGARPGWAGRLAGAVAAGWMIACPPVRGLAATLTPATIALAAIAVAALGLDRVARGGGALAGRALAAAAVTAVMVDARAWPLAGVGAGLLLYRARRGAPWALSTATAGAVTGACWLGVALIAGGPTWSHGHGGGGLAVIVDELGPLALALAVAGAITAIDTRGDRWLALAIAAIAVPALGGAAAGLAAPIAIALGLAVAAFLARAPALRHQLVTAGSVLALLAGAVAWA